MMSFFIRIRVRLQCASEYTRFPQLPVTQQGRYWGREKESRCLNALSKTKSFTSARKMKLSINSRKLSIFYRSFSNGSEVSLDLIITTDVPKTPLAPSEIRALFKAAQERRLRAREQGGVGLWGKLVIIYSL